MAHHNVQSLRAAAQNAVTPTREAADEAQGELDLRLEPRSYASTDVSKSTLAAPAAGEVVDYMDEGEALDGQGVPQGGGPTRRTEAQRGQGANTMAVNRRLGRSGSSDQGVH